MDIQLDINSLNMTGRVQGQEVEQGNLEIPTLPEPVKFHEVKVVMSEDVKGAGTFMWRTIPT
jgi:hypothetical protein